MAKRHNTKRLSALMSLLLLLQECHHVMLHSDNAYNPNDGSTKNKLKKTERNYNKHDSSEDTVKAHERQLVDDISGRRKTRRSTTQLKEVGNISFEEVNQRLQLLVTKYRAQEKVVDKMKIGFKNCSSIDVESIETVGNLKNPKGILVRLMFSVVLSLANCPLTSRHVLYEICNAVDNDVVVEVIETLAELTDDVGQSQNKTKSDTNEEENLLDNDIEVEQEESSFIADMLTENIMNTNEMMNLFDQLSGGGKFENITEVDELLLDIDSFSLDEFTDNPDFKWIRPIGEASNGSLPFRNKSQEILDKLNANATRRHLRKIDMKIDVGKSAKLLVIFDRTTGKMMTSSLNEQLSLEPFNITNLQAQLWIIDKGELINVGSHLYVSCYNDDNKICLLGSKENKGTDIWSMGFDRIKNGNCYLDTNNSAVHLSCDIKSYETDLVCNKFSSSTEPEKLTQESHVLFMNGPLEQLFGDRLVLFLYILGGMVRSLFGLSSETDNMSTKTGALKQTEYFFIKNSLHPCKILMMDYRNINHKIQFGEFSEHHIEHYLWYWNENQIINVATSEALESYNDYGGYTRLWTYGNDTLKSFSNPSCIILETLQTTCNIASDTKYVKQNWTLVPFDQPDFNNFQDVVCMYFIQSEDWPCEYISLDEATHSPLMSPIGENIFLHLWYKSNGKLVNVDTGQMLVIPSKNDSLTYESTWVIQGNSIFSKIFPQNVLMIDVRNNGRITTHSYHQSSAIQKWKFTQIEDAIHDGSKLHCSVDIERNIKRYVIRNNDIPGCLILTAVERNENTFVLDMRPYDENLLDFQTWTHHRGHIINLGTGLTVAPQGNSSKQTGNSYLQLDTLHSYKRFQMWTINFQQGTIYSDMKENGYIDIEKWPYGIDHEINYRFITQEEKIPNSWTFTDISSYEVDEEKSLDLLCFYLLRSLHEPCEFVTADLSKGTLHLRPVSQELLENQIWYWSDNSIILAHTGESIQQTHNNSVILSKSDVQKQWEYDNKGLWCKNCNAGRFLSVDLHNDGIMYLTPERYKTMGLSFVNYEKLLSENLDSCSVSATSGTQLFFLRSHWNKCKVLTGEQYGKSPTFEHLNQDDIERQLWYIKHNHLINLKTNLVLQVVGNEVIMGNFFKYASSQTFQISGNFIFPHTSNCVLDVNTWTSEVILWCHIHGQNNQRWDRITFDDDGNYVNKLTCMFFIRHELTPCELLTDLVPGHTVRLRPPSDTLFNRQLWYWSGNSIINADTGLALEGSYYDIRLRQKLHRSSNQQWTLEGKHLKMKHYLSYRVVGLSGDDIKMVSQNSYLNSKEQHWKFIDAEEGIRNSRLLTCENNLRHTTIYFIKSENEENGKCPLLTERSNEYVDVTTAKASDHYYNQLWVRIRKHILSPKSGRALAVNGRQVQMQSKFEHEHFQHWYFSGNSIRSTVNGDTKLLDTYDDVTVYPYDRTDGQKWTLLEYEDVRSDEKLLRCKKCYNKAEEKASEVMSYIPIFGWLYNLFRAPIYAAKGCDDVALSALLDLGIDLILDAVVAVITVATLGTGSAFALGIKTAAKAGIKAGIKAGVRAITSSIKLAVKQGIHAGKAVLKQGLKKTFINFAKKKMFNFKNILKSSLSTVKKLPKTVKRLTVNTGKNIKSFTSKIFHKVRSTTFGSMKSSVKTGLRSLPKKLKTKLKSIGNSLADRASKRINKLDDLSKNKPKGRIRCRRAGGKKCNIPKKDIPTPKPSAFVEQPDEIIQDNFNRMLRDVKKSYDVDGLQNAHFGITKKSKKKNMYEMDKDTIHSKALNEVDELPFDKDYKRIGKDGKKLQSHTEQALMDDIDKVLKKNCKKARECGDLYLWTKNSPCMENKYKNVGNAKSCFAMLAEKCYDYAKVLKLIGKCHVGFKDFYVKTGIKGNDAAKKEFFKELNDFTLLKNNLESGGKLPIDDLASFIKFYPIP